MKFAIIILACFVGFSYQEPIHSSLGENNQARAYYVPLYYSGGLPAGYDVIASEKLEEAKLRSSGNSFLSRLLGGNLLSPISNLITLTSTTTSTVVTTVTTAKFVKCVPTSLFVAAASTTGCPRNRREVIAELLAGNNEQETIQPAEPELAVASALVEPVPQNREIESEIQSSIGGERTGVFVSLKADERFLGGITTVVSVTKLVTSTTFAPTTITQTKLIATASALSCLPKGYLVCPADATPASVTTTTAATTTAAATTTTAATTTAAATTTTAAATTTTAAATTTTPAADTTTTASTTTTTTDASTTTTTTAATVG